MSSDRQRSTVLHVITGLSIGGAEQALFNLLSGSSKDACESYVVSLIDVGDIGPRIEALGIKVFTLDMPRGRPTFGSILKLRRIVKVVKPTIIQGWMYHGNIAAVVAKIFSSDKCKLVWGVRQTLYDLANEKKLTRWVIKANAMLSFLPDALLYNSHLSKEQHQKVGFSSRFSQVIPNGIDINRFCHNSLDRRSVREKLSISDEAVVVGHVGRFHPMKGHASFLKSIVDVMDIRKNLQVVMIGRDIVPANLELSVLIPTALADRIHLLGEQQDTSSWYSGFDIFCLSSQWGEGFPNVVGEAMACKVPAVVTDVGDSSRIVADCGMSVPIGERKSLCDAVLSMVDLSVDERVQMGRRARARIVGNYALPSIVSCYMNLYQQLDKK
ncbi:glycosyltransferase [Aestuariirhabdus sp. LZHN29]|uniref:glycosyltransferase n=1 Tax=Aestuariirhabdus sp. LZHN29 TaxID=3417462 RepID=UPI003CF829B1